MYDVWRVFSRIHWLKRATFLSATADVLEETVIDCAMASLELLSIGVAVTVIYP